MDERKSDKGYQPEVTSSAHITHPPRESAVAGNVAAASTSVAIPPAKDAIGVVSSASNPTNPVLVSAGTTDTAISQGNVAGMG